MATLVWSISPAGNSGQPLNSTHGVEGVKITQRIPFPPSSIPAYIAQSMKIFVCLSVSGNDVLRLILQQLSVMSTWQDLGGWCSSFFILNLTWIWCAGATASLNCSLCQAGTYLTRSGQGAEGTLDHVSVRLANLYLDSCDVMMACRLYCSCQLQPVQGRELWDRVRSVIASGYIMIGR